jgi:hypothetical protein
MTYEEFVRFEAIAGWANYAMADRCSVDEAAGAIAGLAARIRADNGGEQAFPRSSVALENEVARATCDRPPGPVRPTGGQT